jgi:hypothetical protein
MQNKSFSDILYFERLPAGGAGACTSSATYWGPDKRIHIASNNKEARFHYNTLTGEKEGILLEGTSTNNINSSCNFAATSAWGAVGALFTLSTAESLIEGQVATKHTLANDNLTHGRAQVLGTSATNVINVDCSFAIVENVDAAATSLGIRDQTVGRWICLAKLNWETKVVTVLNQIGTYSRAYANKLLDVGPNGGEVYQLVVIGGYVPNSANTKAVYIYPCGSDPLPETSAQTSVIVHAVQSEPQRFGPSSLIITGNNNVTRAQDRLAVNVNSGFFSSEQGTFVYTVRKTEPGVDNLNSSYLLNFDNNNLKRHLYISTTSFGSYDGTAVLSTSGVNAVSALFETAASAYNTSHRFITANGIAVTNTTFVAGYNVATSNASITGTGGAPYPGIIIKDIQYYPYKLSDAQLRAITTRANN